MAKPAKAKRTTGSFNNILNKFMESTLLTNEIKNNDCK
jgi:hypothetical protein